MGECSRCGDTKRIGNALRTYLYTSISEEKELLLCWSCFMVIDQEVQSEIQDKANIQ